MINFENYIFNPDSVDEHMLEAQDWQLEPIIALESDELLDTAVALEQEVMQARLPRLNVLASSVAGHLRIKHNGRPAMANHFLYGFAIGLMAANRGYNFSNIKTAATKQIEDGRLKTYFKDASADTVELFETSDGVGMDMLLDAIDINTEPKTERLRELLDYRLEMLRPAPELEDAAKMGALVCYSVLTYERKRALLREKGAQWAQYDSENSEQYLIPEQWLSLSSSEAKRQIDGLESLRNSGLAIYRSRANRSRKP